MLEYHIIYIYITYVNTSLTISCIIEYPRGKSRRLLSQMALRTQALASIPRLGAIDKS